MCMSSKEFEQAIIEHSIKYCLAMKEDNNFHHVFSKNNIYDNNDEKLASLFNFFHQYKIFPLITIENESENDFEAIIFPDIKEGDTLDDIQQKSNLLVEQFFDQLDLVFKSVKNINLNHLDYLLPFMLKDTFDLVSTLGRMQAHYILCEKENIMDFIDEINEKIDVTEFMPTTEYPDRVPDSYSTQMNILEGRNAEIYALYTALRVRLIKNKLGRIFKTQNYYRTFELCCKVDERLMKVCKDQFNQTEPRIEKVSSLVITSKPKKYNLKEEVKYYKQFIMAIVVE